MMTGIHLDYLVSQADRIEPVSAWQTLHVMSMLVRHAPQDFAAWPGKFHHFASGARITRLDVDPDKGMAGRCVQGLIDVLEGDYGGDPTKMPYVVNKDAFTP